MSPCRDGEDNFAGSYFEDGGSEFERFLEDGGIEPCGPVVNHRELWAAPPSP